MFSKDTYVQRRAKLMEEVGSGLILLPGNIDVPYNYPDNIYHFRQDSTFRYYCGLDVPGLIAVLDADTREEYLFGNDVDIDDIIWTGPMPTIKEMAAQVGIEKSGALTEVRPLIIKSSGKRSIHYLPPYRSSIKAKLNDLLGISYDEVIEGASMPLRLAVIKQRNKKEAQEIAEIDKAFEIGYKMHTTAIQLCREGMSEQFIAGQMEGIALSYGAGLSFPTILTQHGEVLHNHKPTGILQNGKLMLVDAGAENNEGYCSDHTRTTPVSGKFDARQRDVYQIVVDAHDYALTVARPGNTWKQVHIDTCKVLAQGLKNIGLMKGDIDEAVAAGAHALFMPHGLGHMMGMDVHDMENIGQQYVGYDDEVRPSTQFGLASLRMGRKLEEGFVITDEPGIYFIPDLIDLWRSQNLHTDFLNYDAIEKYKDFGGIRIEDDVIITADGSRFSGDGKLVPYQIDELEEYMANRD